jgi:hypothetical protein
VAVLDSDKHEWRSKPPTPQITTTMPQRWVYFTAAMSTPILPPFFLARAVAVAGLRLLVVGGVPAGAAFFSWGATFSAMAMSMGSTCSRSNPMEASVVGTAQRRAWRDCGAQGVATQVQHASCER